AGATNSRPSRPLTKDRSRSTTRCRRPLTPSVPQSTNSSRRRCMLLAGDIGGTKTVLAVFSPEAGAHAPLAEATFPSGRYGRLEAIVREFLGQVTFPIDRA